MLLCIGFLSIGGICLGQSNFAKKYTDLLNPESKLRASGFNFTVEELQSGEYLYKRYYPETRQITHLISYSTKKLDERNGPYEERYDDGTFLHKGIFQRNLKEGNWIENEQEEGEYLKGQRVGTWIRLDSSARKVSESNYVDGQVDGYVIHYDTTGHIKNRELFKAGERVSVEGDPTSPETMPLFPGCAEVDGSRVKECSDRKLLEYIYSRIKYPKIARNAGAEGEALIRFIIEKDGNISSIKALRSVTKEIAQECIRIVEGMPRWIPGKVDGEPVRVQFNLPVKFKLE